MHIYISGSNWRTVGQNWPVNQCWLALRVTLIKRNRTYNYRYIYI